MLRPGDFWEKAFRALMTILTSLSVAGVGALYKINNDMTDRLARIETGMVVKTDLEMISTRLSRSELNIAVLDATCRKKGN